MKKSLVLVIISVITLNLFSQKNHLYKCPDLNKIAKKHKVIAIIPFEPSTSLLPQETEGMDQGQKEFVKIKRSEVISSFCDWFIEKQQKNSLSVKVQNFSTTMNILQNAGITTKNHERYTSSEVATILNVDAIIKIGIQEKPQEAVLKLYLFNASDGELLINYSNSISYSDSESTGELVNLFMKKASKKIPYLSQH